MRIQVHLFSILRQHLPPGGEAGQASIELPDGNTVADLIEHLGITRRVRLVMVNGAQEKSLERRLRDGDIVKLFPTMVGG